jgi:arylsulfatase A-like enzyme
MVSPSFKLILPNAANEPGKEPELYDLQSDPWETVNLARERERQADVIRMRNLIDQWWSPGRTGPRPPPRRPDGRTNGP